MEMAELTKLIKSRRSIRVWQDKPVSEKLLLQAIELATWAPNGGNQQNWYFYLILKKNTIKAVADATQAGMSYMTSWPEMAQFRGFPPPGRVPPGGSPPPAPRRAPLSDAPALIAVGTRRTENPLAKVMLAREKTDKKAAEMLQWNKAIDSRIQSVSAAIAYLLLVLHQMGLGAVWMTGPLPSSKGDVEKILKVPPEMDIIALIPVGYPAESPTRDRRPVSEVCEVIK
jgi:nitroreductase